MIWKGSDTAINPASVLETAAERADVVEGLVPLNGITWLYGASMSYKTFAAMSLAVAVSQDAPWIGRKTQWAAVVYVGAEGGASLHVRRAAAEIATGRSGEMFVVTERPQLDTPQGAARLHGILNGLTEIVPGEYDDVELDTIYCAAERAYSGIAGTLSAPDVLCIIDTYSQTSAGDDKVNVSAYVKNLRAIADAAEGTNVSFIVVDHATKAGGSYMGSVAKLNDVDSQIEVVRVSDRRATLYQRKVKDGIESAPLALEVLPFVLEGYVDAYGKPLTSMVVQDGSRAEKIAGLAEGKAGILLGILTERKAPLPEVELRGLFAAHPDNAGIKPDSVGKAYRRARDSLLDAGLATDETGLLTAV